MKFNIQSGPSVNAMYRNVPGVGRVKSTEYKQWAKAALQELTFAMLAYKRSQTATPKPPLCLTIHVPDTGGRGDASNRIKAVEDVLVRAGIIADDNDKIIRKLVVEVGAANGRCEIELEEYR